MVALLAAASCAPSFAQEGSPTGYWTDLNGVNHYGPAPNLSARVSTGGFGTVGNAMTAQQLAYGRNETGRLFYARGDYEKALLWFREAAQYDPGCGIYAANIRLTEDVMRRNALWEQRNRVFTAAEEKANLASAAFDRGDFVAAEQHYREAQAINPGEDSYRHNIAAARHNQTLQAEALKFKVADSAFDEAIAAYNRQDYELAAQLARKAHAAYPDEMYAILAAQGESRAREKSQVRDVTAAKSAGLQRIADLMSQGGGFDNGAPPCNANPDTEGGLATPPGPPQTDAAGSGATVSVGPETVDARTPYRGSETGASPTTGSGGQLVLPADRTDLSLLYTDTDSTPVPPPQTKAQGGFIQWVKSLFGP